MLLGQYEKGATLTLSDEQMNDLVSVEGQFEGLEGVDGRFQDFIWRAMTDHVSEDMKGTVKR